MARRVWITRASPGAEATGQRVRALGFEAVVAPLLEVRAVGDGPIELSGVGAIAFTSVNGVEAFASRVADRSRRVFSVGAATAAAATSVGFANVVSSDGDVGALAAVIAAHKHEIDGMVLHAAAAELTGDLSGAGVPVRRLTIYETVPASVPDDVRAMIPALYAVLVHSAKAARLLAAILREIPAPASRVLCLSPAVATAISGVAAGEITAAALPNEEALLNLLVDRGFQ